MRTNTMQNVAARRLTAVALVLVAVLAAAAVAPSQALAASGDIASGTSGSCDWAIDAEGELTISPSSGSSGTLGSVDDFGDAPWNDDRDSIASVVIEDGVSAGSAAVGLFYDCENLVSVEGADNLDVSDTEDFSGMFYRCSSLVSLDLSGWDISSAEDMSSMFYNCSSLVSLDVSGWDVSNVTSMSAMFSRCSALEVLDLSSWDTSSASSMGGMFSNCTGLVRVTLGSGFSFTGGGYTSCELPTPLDDDGTEGVWMNEDTGVTYDDPGDIPSNTAATYVAVFDGVVATPSTGYAEEEDDGLFTDAKNADSWYYDAVCAMAEAGYITGYDDGSFGVGDKMTRGQFVSILWRIACPDEYAAYDNDAANESGLSDVKDGTWYTAAVNWGVEEGVVTGYSNGTFGVNDSMSFQDMCLIIARYAGAADGSYEAITYAEGDEVLDPFTDASDISRYAEPGMVWCIQNGLVDGNDDGTLAPKSKVARERVAVVLYRAIEADIL